MLEANGLVKLAEECGELTQVCMKRVAFKDGDVHWDGSNLKERLEEEIADVIAATSVVVGTNDLDQERIHRRAQEKVDLLLYWHDGGTETSIPISDSVNSVMT